MSGSRHVAAFAGSSRWDGLITAERLRRYSLALLSAYAIALVGLIALARNGVDRNGVPLGADFVQFYAAARLALDGRPLAVFSLADIQAMAQALFPGAQGLFLWFYPPTFLLVVLPFGFLPYMAAYAAFMAASGALYLLTAKVLIGHRSWPLFALAFPAAFLNVIHGQTGFLIVALLGLGLTTLPKRPLLAGALLGLASFKPHLGLVVPVVLIAGGHVRAFAGATVTTLLAVGISTLAFGPEIWPAFIRNLAIIGDFARTSPDIWHKIPSVFITLRLLGVPEATAFAVHGAVAAAAILATAHAWRRPGPHDLKVALAATACLLASPYVMNYDLILIGIPIAVMARRAANGQRPSQAGLLLAAALSPLLIGFVAVVHVQIVAPILWALYVTVWMSLRNERAASTTRGVPRTAAQP